MNSLYWNTVLVLVAPQSQICAGTFGSESGVAILSVHLPLNPSSSPVLSCPLHFTAFFLSICFSLICHLPVKFPFFLPGTLSLFSAFLWRRSVTVRLNSAAWHWHLMAQWLVNVCRIFACVCSLSMFLSGRQHWKYMMGFHSFGHSLNKKRQMDWITHEEQTQRSHRSQWDD